ncbi:MAG TPA: hypothetical protein DGD08_10425 [Gemmatimonas aurantiaca]|uniref:Beta-lactamase-related domain-containing protein n=2 Tax=Gemmatimonas aurantiaca TaxID=173480 RepID=A0A3D4VA40_9BACT|nr:serine hydrolase domain-containing protein [Gemmatimonas aurantiaca]BAH40388.1 putative D-stereospecific endopeptidase [Gemmatimonas aurantiaca T-27]HCT57602.1 hypothetical protein [Gemmatimonas aurantiaca]
MSLFTHPGRIALALTLSLTTLARPAGSQTPAIVTSRPTLAAEVDTYARKTGFSGTVHIEHRGRRLLQRHYGLAERSFGVPVDSTTRFWVASITKLFTATLILQQVEAGHIDPAATIRTYLKDYTGPAADRVTVHQLLNHTSGLEQFEHITSYDDAVRKGMPEYQIPHTSRELLDLYASGPVNTNPGSAFNYNNADYIVLGAILERVTNTSYDRLLRERILEPLGMTHTGLMRAQAITPRLAATYMRADTAAPLLRDLPIFPENWWAAGALYSTASDLAVFARALYGGRLLKPASLAALLNPGLEEYGYGLWIASQNIEGTKHRFAQRPGQIMGANVTLLRYLDDDLTIIILGNTNLADIDRFGFLIGRTVLR